MRRILVTGGAGFIGSEFIRQMMKYTEDEVTNVDLLTYASSENALREVDSHPRYRFIQGDVSKKSDVERIFEQPYDVVVHFAAESHVDRSIESPERFLETNIMGTYQLLEQVKRSPQTRFLQVSTDEVYGSLGNGDSSFTSTTPLSPTNPYAVSKASADMLVLSYVRTYGIKAMVSRCSNNYGPYQHEEKFIPKVIRNALTNQPIPIYGDGQQIRDWLFVEDHCEGLRKLLDVGKSGEVYHFGGLQEKRNIEVVEQVLAYLQKPRSLLQHVQDRKGHDYRYSMCWKETEKSIKWRPSTPFDEGLKRTIRWYEENMK
ncbi:dTDP-glucose 4,6-dehydratase [Priestia koreensis]|uniref:dTDP-glucose 4,6-dehydratase n=1 Tax=Priestia koreensis TaxID=284581 RepID=UPI00207055B5|nr:dTDP-glucose 4,6-dehydratase [Priestia koreensis]UNL85702.1 dTDP-glucose 4,6-dehydratase [Priestia koreensis]